MTSIARLAAVASAMSAMSALAATSARITDAAPWHAGVLDPQGPVAAAERTILLNATVIMLAVVLPVIIGTVAVAWWFRAGNARARRRPDWAYSGPVELTVWGVPMLVVLFLAGIGWVGSHDLDPRKPLGPADAHLDVQVVSLDWKWLFIYPQAGVASVNELVVPAGVPLRLSLTSASVMNSFFVPQLGSQIYTMAGMATQLHLQADKPGTYTGLSAQFSGEGFSHMRLRVVALPQARFDAWLADSRAGNGNGNGNGNAALDAAAYARLAQPGIAPAAVRYGSVAPGLFDSILMAGMAAPMPDPSAGSAGSAGSPASPGSAPAHHLTPMKH